MLQVRCARYAGVCRHGAECGPPALRRGLDSPGASGDVVHCSTPNSGRRGDAQDGGVEGLAPQHGEHREYGE